MKSRSVLALALFLFLVGPAAAQNVTCATRPPGDDTNACASTAFVQAATGGGGSVSSVGASFTGGLVSISGSPITTSGTLGFTVAGTSGGVPYFSSTSAWASSGLLTANLPVIGGGAGAAPGVGTVSGNTTQFVTTTGAQTSGDCVEIDASGNHIASGAACGGGGGSGTVTSVAQSFTGGLISVAGSPITTSGTLALTVAGTSGGIPYFSSGTAWASSGALTANAIILGGGAGAAPTPLGSLGTTTTVLHGNAVGAPTFGAVSLTADVSGTLPTGNLPTATAANVQTGTSTTTVVTPSALSGSAALQTLTDGATINWDVASGYNAKVTLTASGHNMAAPTNLIVGITYTATIIQDATGSRTMTWDSIFKWGTAGTPTLSTPAAAKDVITCFAYDASNLLCSASIGF